MELTMMILEHLQKNDSVDSIQLSQLLKEDHQKIIGTIKSLQSVGNVIDVEQQMSRSWELTHEGLAVADKGSHEALIYYSVPEVGGIVQAELMKSVPTAMIGFSKAMSAGWIQIEKIQNKAMVKRKVVKIEDSVQQSLQKIRSSNDDEITEAQKQELKKRKLLQDVTIKKYIIHKGTDFNISLMKLETDLTSNMLPKQVWKEVQFKSYNFDALGPVLSSGHLHPLMKVREEFRKIFLEMGFTEMKTDNFIENSFWNFDALFQPQQHPARDAHDTFFVSDPQYASYFPDDYLQKVKTVHERGGYGSQGYKYVWKLDEAKKNLLRTHTTAVSARMLHQLAQQQEFHPVKYFSIDRVFRNETLDATHLAEFHQIEGVIADYNLTLGHLIGVLYEFFKKLGISKLRFKPAYNPYTEPSMEIFSYHEGLGKWVEVGNSGVFRPEMLLPMGLPPDVQVVAWGLSLERPTMIKYGINNIRDLVGHKVNLQMVQENAICRLHKKSRDDLPRSEISTMMENRQKQILLKLQNIWIEVKNIHESLRSDTETLLELELSKQHSPNPVTKNGMKKPSVSKLQNNLASPETTTLLVYCNPGHPLWSLASLVNQLYDQMAVEVNVTADPTIPNINQRLMSFITTSQVHPAKTQPLFLLQLCWNECRDDPMMITSGKCILGEVNILRYFGRVLELYDCNDPVTATIIDSWLDRIQKSIFSGNNMTRELFLKELNQHLENNSWLMGNLYSIADLGLWSALHHFDSVKHCPLNVLRWINNCSSVSWNISTASFISDYY